MVFFFNLVNTTNCAQKYFVVNIYELFIGLLLYMDRQNQEIKSSYPSFKINHK